MFPLMRSYTYVHTLSHALELVADLDGATVVIDLGTCGADTRLVELVQTHVADIGTVQLTDISRSRSNGCVLSRARSRRATFLSVSSSRPSTPRATAVGTSTRS